MSFWTSPNSGLQGLLSTLVPLAQSLSQSREQSLASRRSLAEKTKDFKKAVAENASPPPDVKALLRCYQDEIDTLTRRCKSSDAGVSDVLTLLRQAPDPSSLLASVMSPPPSSSSTSSSSTTSSSTSSSSVGAAASAALVSELQAELAAYEMEFNALKNQDIKVRTLEREVLSLQSQLSSVKSASSFHVLTASSSASRETDLLHEVSRLTSALSSERDSRLGLSRMLALRDVATADQDDAQRAASSLLLEHHAGEASRLSDVVASLTGDNAALRRKVERLDLLARDQEGPRGEEGERASETSGGRDGRDGGRTGEGGGQRAAAERDAYEAEISDLTLAAARQKEEICSLSMALNSLQDEKGREAAELNEQVAALRKDFQAAKARGDERPTVQELDKAKRERRRLRRALRDLAAASGGGIVVARSLSSASSEMTDGDGDGDSADGDDDDAGDLDTVLSARLRTVEASLLAARREAAERIEALRDSDEHLRASERERDRLKGLVDKLDEDLGQVLKQQQQQQQALLQSGTNLDDNGAMLQRVLLDPKSPLPSAIPSATNSIMSSLSPFPPLGAMSPFPATMSSLSSSTPPLIASSSSSSEGFVGIVMSQRDRLKEKVAALESERDGFRKELDSQVRLADNLQRENLQMYEKVKFMNARGAVANGAVARNGGGGGGGGGAGSASAYDDVDLDALEARYEVHDPFKQFAAEEKKRRLKKITAVEKTVFNVAKMVLSNSEARNALFFYVIGMHALVFITCYHWAHEKTCDQITDFHPSLISPAEISHMTGNGPPPLDFGGKQ